MAGPGAMKGASPVSQVQQAETEIGSWLGSNMADTGGALKVVLHRHLKGSRLLLDNLDQPLAALAGYCRAVLAADSRLKEIVREADVEWGRAMDERPHFDRESAPANPDDPYTAEPFGGLWRCPGANPGGSWLVRVGEGETKKGQRSALPLRTRSFCLDDQPGRKLRGRKRSNTATWLQYFTNYANML